MNLLTQTCWLEEAEADGHWHPRYCNAQVAIANCIEVAVPWSDLHIDPGCELHLLAISANNGKFSEHFPDHQLISIRMP